LTTRFQYQYYVSNSFYKEGKYYVCWNLYFENYDSSSDTIDPKILNAKWGCRDPFDLDENLYYLSLENSQNKPDIDIIAY
jgi:hypothetical protein